MDGLNAVVPYGEGANLYDARATQRVVEPGNAAGAALELDGFFGLHPALVPLADIYRAGDLGVVHAVGQHRSITLALRRYAVYGKRHAGHQDDRYGLVGATLKKRRVAEQFTLPGGRDGRDATRFTAR